MTTHNARATCDGYDWRDGTPRECALRLGHRGSCSGDPCEHPVYMDGRCYDCGEPHPEDCDCGMRPPSRGKRHAHLPLWPRRLWLNLSVGREFLTLAFQHRVARAPAMPQTCHHAVILRWAGEGWRGVRLSRSAL